MQSKKVQSVPGLLATIVRIADAEEYKKIRTSDNEFQRSLVSALPYLNLFK